MSSLVEGRGDFKTESDNRESVMKSPDYSGYEAAKRRWIAKHPNHTPEQYQQAMRRIAALYGV